MLFSITWNQEATERLSEEAKGNMARSRSGRAFHRRLVDRPQHALPSYECAHVIRIGSHSTSEARHHRRGGRHENHNRELGPTSAL